MNRKKDPRKAKGIAAGVAALLFFFYAMCVDGIVEMYGLGTLVLVSLIVFPICALCVWYSNLPEGRG